MNIQLKYVCMMLVGIFSAVDCFSSAAPAVTSPRSGKDQKPFDAASYPQPTNHQSDDGDYIVLTIKDQISKGSEIGKVTEDLARKKIEITDFNQQDAYEILRSSFQDRFVDEKIVPMHFGKFKVLFDNVMISTSHIDMVNGGSTIVRNFFQCLYARMTATWYKWKTSNINDDEAIESQSFAIKQSLKFHKNVFMTYDPDYYNDHLNGVSGCKRCVSLKHECDPAQQDQ